MPKGYAIFTETIRDQAGYDAYVEKAIPTIVDAEAGRSSCTTIPRCWRGSPPGRASSRWSSTPWKPRANWYSSPAYQVVVGERHASTDADAVIVGGFEMPSA